LSSILKALKKIEGQSPPPQSFPGLPDSVDARQAVTSRARKRWRRRRIITVSLVLVVIAVTAVIVFQQRQFVISKIFPAGSPATKSKAAQKTPKIYKAKIAPAAVRQAAKNRAPRRPARQSLKKVVPGPKPKKLRTDTRSARSRVKVGRQTPKPGPAIPSKQPPNSSFSDKPFPKQSSQHKLIPSKKSIAGKRAASVKSAAATPKAKKVKTYAKLNDSQIKLQALAWSGDAARRMAVINGRIVREGESMDGYQIDRIRQEDVILSDGKQSWSLEFGLKQ
jgi:hypothetical protein